MRRELPAYLWDVRQACDDIFTFTRDVSYQQYEQNVMIHAAVERMFEIIGEALRQLADHFPAKVERIDEYRRFIDFRNVLAHQYSFIVHGVVWDVIQSRLSNLREQVAVWLIELDPEAQL